MQSYRGLRLAKWQSTTQCTSPVISAGTAFTGINQPQRLVCARSSKTRYAHLNANWLEMNNRLSKGDLPWYQANINNYVNQIDLFVLALQHYAERKMLLVVAISTAGGIGIFTLVFLLCAAYAIRWLPR